MNTTFIVPDPDTNRFAREREREREILKNRVGWRVLLWTRNILRPRVYFHTVC